MANFFQRKGTPGVWSESENTLTVHLGEVAQLGLYGGGPGGADLVVGMAGSKNKSVEDKHTPMGPSERLFSVTPLETGIITVVARVGSATGGDYSAPAKIVVLPRSTSSLGPEHVILWAGVKDKGDDIQEAYNKVRKSASNATVYGLDSFASFVKLLDNYRDSGRRINKLEFNTHGSPGSVRMGETDRMTAAWVRTLKGKGYESIFTPGANIFFHGCNVAEGAKGREFLIEVGTTLLRGGGGSVGGSTSLGIGLGSSAFGNGKVYHLWGDTVRVFVAQGGRVTEVTEQ